MIQINENMSIENGTVACTHCATTLSEAGESTLHRAMLRVGPVSDAGPGIRVGVPSFTPEAVEFRQYLCPGCMTALLTETVAAADTATRVAVVSAG